MSHKNNNPFITTRNAYDNLDIALELQKHCPRDRKHREIGNRESLMMKHPTNEVYHQMRVTNNCLIETKYKIKKLDRRIAHQQAKSKKLLALLQQEEAENCDLRTAMLNIATAKFN